MREEKTIPFPFEEDKTTNATLFKDVIGLKNAKNELKEIVDFLKNPKKYERMGARLPKGILLHGESGSGKTLLARALANECGGRFIYANGSEFIEKFVGVGAQRVRQLFERARECVPAIVFIDEIDGIGVSRLSDTNSERDQTLNQFLVELDGFVKLDRVVVIGATNRFDMLDKALLRPGRFDRHIYMPNPNYEERIKLFEYYLKKKPKEKDLDIQNAARLTMGLNGSHIESIVNESALLCIREGEKKINTQVLQKAFLKVASGILATQSILSEEERNIVATHEAAHGVCHIKLYGKLPRHMSIVQGAKYLGCVIADEEERTLYTKNDLFNKICLLLAGKTGEELCLGAFSTGAKNDIQRASALAKEMICDYCMGDYENIALLENEQDRVLCQEIFEQKQKLLQKAHNCTKELLKNNREMLTTLKNALLERDTLCHSEIEELLRKECYLS